MNYFPQVRSGLKQYFRSGYLTPSQAVLFKKPQYHKFRKITLIVAVIQIRLVINMATLFTVGVKYKYTKIKTDQRVTYFNSELFQCTLWLRVLP